MIKKLVIYGVGLIGGSFALALKSAGAVETVVGFGRNRETLHEAERLKVIDRAGTDEADELSDADLVLLATPVGQMAAIMTRIAPLIGPQTVVSDAGSTKSDVVAAARSAFSGHIDRFIPAHPIAGAENSGVGAALAGLYRDKRIVLTPLPENAEWAVERVADAWQTCGGLIHRLPAATHDRIFAGVSHLPHLLSFALVHDLALREDQALYFTFAASGFRDFTRIAASHPEMWRDICLANRDALLSELDSYRAVLDELAQALATGNGVVLEAIFDSARRARRNWAETKPS